MLTLTTDDDRAVALVQAIRTGDADRLGRLLGEHEGLSRAWIRDRKGGSRSPLHVATDWPGYFPNGPDVVRVLIAAGADPNAAMAGGGHAETPLHWAASSDDLDVADALLDAGADLEALGGSIAGGTPLDNAVGYGCWHVARRLVERGARVDRLWHAASLGMLARMHELLAADPPPTTEEIANAFWQACHGGQLRAAELLLGRGADVNWIPDYAEGTGLDVAGGPDTRRGLLVTWLGEHGGGHAAE
ncbi:MAG TPA: ankyrin repeat domain-containing protein [Gaiellales bacterium]|nr:ankyrin repeat domain-containing protein [Gaiellales bacterium]